MSQLVWDEGPSPVGAACANDDVVVVVDGTAVVRAYDADGGILAAVELHATADGEPHKGRPPQWTGITFCGTDDSIAVLSDAANARVCVMHCPDPTLAEPMVLLAEAGAAGADGHPGIGLRSPRGLAVDYASGAVIVADAGRHSCLVLLPTVPQLVEALRIGATTEGGAHVAAAVHAEAVHSGLGAMTVVAELVGLEDPSAVALVRAQAADPGHAPLLLAAVADTGAHSVAVFVIGDSLLVPGREPVRLGEAWRVGRPGRGDGEMVHPLGVAVWQPGAFAPDQQAEGAKSRLREPCRAEDAVLVACDAGNARLQAWPLCGPASAVLWIIERAGDTEAEAMVRPAALCLSSEGEALVVDVGRGAWIMLPDDRSPLSPARSEGSSPGREPVAASGARRASPGRRSAGSDAGPAWELAADASSSDDSFLRETRQEVQLAAARSDARAGPEGEGGVEALAGASSDEEDREAAELARGGRGPSGARSRLAGPGSPAPAGARAVAGAGAGGEGARQSWGDDVDVATASRAREEERRRRLGLRPPGDPYRPPSWNPRAAMEYVAPEPWRARRLELHPPGWGTEAARRRLHRRARQEREGRSAQDRQAVTRQSNADAEWADAIAAAERQEEEAAERERRRAELSGCPDDTESRDTGLALLRRTRQTELDTAAKRRALVAAVAANEATVASLAVFAPALALAGARPRDTPPDAHRLCRSAGDEAPRDRPATRDESHGSQHLPPVPRWLSAEDVPAPPDYAECRSETALRARLVDLKAACKLVAADVAAWEAAGRAPAAEAERLAELVDAVRTRAGAAATPGKDPLTVDQALAMVRQAEARRDEAQAALREAEEEAAAEAAAWESKRRRLRAELADQREQSERARKAGTTLGAELAMAGRRLELLRQEQAELRQREATRLARLSSSDR
ncbi:hypothetical protein FNF28_07140 [Cafeteria roenbergensis]|uniref:Uncharacterized protein n=1 Tax=Cafeteria roenbergensis TaxID=33653 RepID=A0A5A8CEF6_CAFRO|nr:hypothetical protein FNF28_07140 [Cafeteria roenbergensis]